MSGMHSTFSSTITGDRQHSYAILSAIQEGSQSQSSHGQRQHSDVASVSSFGSSVSLLKDKFHRSYNTAPASGKSSSLVARQRAAENPSAQVLQSQSSKFWASSARQDL